MKKFFIGLTATVIAITGIFTFVGCEKEETKTDNPQLATENAIAHTDTERINEIDATTFPNGFTPLFGIYEIQQY